MTHLTPPEFRKVDGKTDIKIPSHGVAALTVIPPNNDTCLLLRAQQKEYKITFTYDNTGQLNARWLKDDQFIVCEPTKIAIRSLKKVLKGEIKVERGIYLQPHLQLTRNSSPDHFCLWQRHTSQLDRRSLHHAVLKRED